VANNLRVYGSSYTLQVTQSIMWPVQQEAILHRKLYKAHVERTQGITDKR